MIGHGLRRAERPGLNKIDGVIRHIGVGELERLTRAGRQSRDWLQFDGFATERVALR
jgi:hypothetical protein